MESIGAIERVRSPFDLPTYQKRLRHLRSISMRNLQCKSFGGEELRQIAVYFTLHSHRKSQAVYTSEKINGSMNPTWQGFDMSCLEDKINTISRTVVIKIWIQLKSKVRLLVDLEVCFDGLIFLADRLQVEGMRYLPNTVIFGLFDKYFIESTQPKVENKADTMKMLYVYQSNLRSSYNTSSLSRVQTVWRAVKQTEASVDKLHQCIQDKLISSQIAQNKLTEREELLLKINQLKCELCWQTARLQADKDKYDIKKEAIRTRYERLKENRQSIKNNRIKHDEIKQIYNQHREKWIKESAQLLIRRKQLIGELSTSVFPVTESEKGDYYICGVKLPNSESYQGQDETMIAVSLGYTCHLTIMMAQILNLPLRYNMEFRGSRSQIRDHIHTKLTDKDRDFPLYSKGKEKFQFNYGVFLLNKNISQLRFYCGLGTSDLRLTLPNIKTLLELRLGVKGEHSILRSLTAPSTTAGGGIGSNNSLLKEGPRSTAGSSSTSSTARQEQTALLQSLDAEITELQRKHDNSDQHADVSIKIQKPEKFDESEELFAKSEDSFFKLPKMSNLSTDSKIAQCDDVIDAINLKANLIQSERGSNSVSLHSHNSNSNSQICDNLSHNSTDSNSSLLQNGSVTSFDRKDSDPTTSAMLNPEIARTKMADSEEFNSSIE